MSYAFSVALRATWQLFSSAVAETVKLFRKTWYCSIIPFALLIASSLLMPLVRGIFPGIAGGFILGLLMAFLLAALLACIGVVLRDGKFSKDEALLRARELFSPVISVLFIIYILSLTLHVFFPGKLWLQYGANLVMVVLLNALPEIVAIEGNNGIQAMQASYEFVRDNFFEWLGLNLVLLLPVLVVNPYFVFLFFSAQDPMNAIFNLVQLTLVVSFSQGGMLSILLFLVALGYLYFSLLLRGSVFLKLSSSSRRSRMYRAQG